MPEHDEKREDPGKAIKAKSQEEYARRMKGKPTPTQDELDRANLGEHIPEHEADGSDPDESAMGTKHAEGKPGAGYSTRQSTPQHQTAQHQTTQHRKAE